MNDKRFRTVHLCCNFMKTCCFLVPFFVTLSFLHMNTYLAPGLAHCLWSVCVNAEPKGAGRVPGGKPESGGGVPGEDRQGGQLRI